MNAKLPILCCALTLSFASSSTARAQLVNVRTAPVSVGEQFYTFPSRTLGMGGGFAVADLEADPFANPATGARIHGAIVSSTPTLYTMPDNSGFGRTLPITLMGGNERTFGGLSFAGQELESAQLNGFIMPLNANTNTNSTTRHSDRFVHNFYTFGMIGQKWADRKAALALSVSYAKLDGLHMVDILYPSAASIEQGGHISDIRLGYLKEYEGAQSFEAVVVRNHVDMDHTVTFMDWSFPPQGGATVTPRVEYNSDQTTTWGAHLAYRRPMPDSKWQLAAFSTANTKSHPKIPNYTFMSIPRDPGNSWAFAFGVGAAHVDRTTTLTFDLTYEPIWTSTWAEAGSTLKSRTGKTIPIGAPTIENQFVFSNSNAHAGWMHNFDKTLGVQAGLDILRIKYWLDQYDDVQETSRQQDEAWTELTLSWGMTLDFADFQLRYFGHAKGDGNIFPNDRDWAVSEPMADSGGPDIVAAPSGPLSMQVTSVIVHQIGVSIPFGRKR